MFEDLRKGLEVVDLWVDDIVDFFCDFDALVDVVSLGEDVLPAPSDEAAEDERDDDDDADHDGFCDIFWREEGGVDLVHVIVEEFAGTDFFFLFDDDLFLLAPGGDFCTEPASESAGASESEARWGGSPSIFGGQFSLEFVKVFEF